MRVHGRRVLVVAVVASLLSGSAWGVAEDEVALGGSLAYLRSTAGRDRQLVIAGGDGRHGVVDETGDQGFLQGPLAWSPDGRTVTYTKAFAGSATDQVMLLDDEAGAEPRSLAHGAHAAWSPDGRRLAYQNPRGALVVHALDSGEVREVDPGTRTPDAQFTKHLCQAWSPNGTMIATFLESTEDQAGEDYRWEVRVVRADGSGLVGMAETTGVACPVWSPDGDRVAFHDYGSPIRTMRPDGTDPRTIGQPGCEASRSPTWHESGLAFFRFDAGPRGTELAGACVERFTSGIWIAHDDGRLELLWEAEDVIGPLTYLSWAPTGRALVYQRQHGTGDDARIELWAVNIDGVTAPVAPVDTKASFDGVVAPTRAAQPDDLGQPSSASTTRDRAGERDDSDDPTALQTTPSDADQRADQPQPTDARDENLGDAAPAAGQTPGTESPRDEPDNARWPILLAAALLANAAALLLKRKRPWSRSAP